MAKTVVGNCGSAFGAPGGRWIVGTLAVGGTLLLAYVLSPGLRADLGGLSALAALVGEVYATGVKDFVLSFGAFSPIVYFIAMVAQVFVAPIPSAPVALVGSLVFGVWEGLVLSLAGSVVGSVLAFLAVRRWGEPLVERLVGREVLGRYSGKPDGGGGWLFAVLLVPFAPDDAAVALAGLSKLSFWWFVPVMVAGRVPGSTTTALLASEWVTGSAAAWISAGIVVVAVLALGFAYRERLESWTLRPADHGQTGARFAAGSREEEPPRGEEPRWAPDRDRPVAPGRAWNEEIQKTLREEGVVDEFALSYAARFESSPERLIYCEHGNQFDPANDITDYDDPLDTPFGDHIVTDVVRRISPAGRIGRDLDLRDVAWSTRW